MNNITRPARPPLRMLRQAGVWKRAMDYSLLDLLRCRQLPQDATALRARASLKVQALPLFA